MASPEYPIRPGDAAGDGALHMTQHPEYPIDPAAAAAPKPPAAPVQPAPPADDDAPHAVPRSSVESTDLPPPSGAAPAPQTTSQVDRGRFERAVTLDRSSLLAATLRSGVIWDDGQPAFGAATGLEPVALRLHHPHSATSKDAKAGKSKVGAKTKSKPKPKAKSGRHAKHSETASAEAAVSEIETPYETKVRPGERAGDVAARLHVSKQALMALNNIKPTSKLHPGEVLKTPYRLAYTVGQGDTLFAIAHRFGQDMDAVAKQNGLKHAAALHLGQTIALPLTAEDSGPREHAQGHAPQPEAAPAKLVEAELAKARAAAHRTAREEAAKLAAARETPPAPLSVATAAAPASQAAPSQAPSSQAPNSKASGSPADEADVDNGVRMAAELNERELASRAAPAPAPGYSVSKEMAAERPAAATPWSTPESTPAPAPAAPSRVATLNTPSYYPPGYNTPMLGRVRPTAPTGATGPASDAEVSTAGRGRFIWPLKGAILTPFGDRGPGQRNDGLDISASTGESVKAAAGGEVVYAGSSIPGFGNLVLVKHPGGWVTAYAHLDRIEVRMRDEVTQGEEIGQAGQTGVVDRPELHFEIRYAADPSEKARPVDPTLVLPEAAKGAG
jgi:murein DD-endopeptidase MepM/ murein hydrolase activator NlpD